MEKETFTDKELTRFLDKFITIKINGDKDKQTTQKFAVTGYPTLVFTDHEGKVIEKIVGFLPVKSLREKMKTVLSQGEKPSQSENPQANAETPQNIQTPVQGEQRNAEVGQEKNIIAEVVQPSPPENESPDRYHELAHSYEKQGDLEKATEFFRKAIELAPDAWKHRRCFGMLLIRTGDFTEAIRHLERASELNAGDPEIFHQLGHALWRINDFQRSIFSFERAIGLAQDNQQYFACAAKAYYELGLMESDPNRSQAYLKKALTLINKLPYRSDTPGEVRNLKFQISKAYSVAVKKSLPMRRMNYSYGNY